MEYKWIKPQEHYNIDREKITKLSWAVVIIESRHADCSHPVYTSTPPTINDEKYAHLGGNTLCNWSQVWLKLKTIAT